MADNYLKDESMSLVIRDRINDKQTMAYCGISYSNENNEQLLIITIWVKLPNLTVRKRVKADKSIYSLQSHLYKL